MIQDPALSSATSPLVARRPPSAARSLAPREHGAYGQLGLPLVTALAMGRPSASAMLLGVASVATFLAHEPLLVVTGQRGTRAAREDRDRALMRLALLGVVAGAAGAAGLVAAPMAARVAVALPLGLAALLAPFVLRNQEKTAPGELLAAAALSSTAVPVALAAGVAGDLTWGAWLAWCLGLGAATLSVRAVVAHARAPLVAARRLALPAAMVALTLVLSGFGVLGPAAALGVLPMLLLALVLAAQPPSPRSLKRVGWGLVAASVLLGIALAVGAHL